MHATLQPVVCWLVSPSVCNTLLFWLLSLFFFSFFFFAPLPLPKYLAGLFHYCPCPSARDLGSRIQLRSRFVLSCLVLFCLLSDFSALRTVNTPQIPLTFASFHLQCPCICGECRRNIPRKRRIPLRRSRRRISRVEGHRPPPTRSKNKSKNRPFSNFVTPRINSDTYFLLFEQVLLMETSF